MGVPAVFLFEDGKKINEVRGKLPKDEFRKWLEAHLEN